MTWDKPDLRDLGASKCQWDFFFLSLKIGWKSPSHTPLSAQQPSWTRKCFSYKFKNLSLFANICGKMEHFYMKRGKHGTELSSCWGAMLHSVHCFWHRLLFLPYFTGCLDGYQFCITSPKKFEKRVEAVFCCTFCLHISNSLEKLDNCLWQVAVYCILLFCFS